MHASIINKRNRYAVSGKVATLTIVRRDGTEHVVRFDRDRLDDVRRHVWHVKRSRSDRLGAYSGDAGRHEEFPLTHLIMGVPTYPNVVYQISGDWTDCRAANLRLGTRSDLAYNRERLKGEK